MSSILAVGHEDRNIRWPHRGAANLTLRISELNVRIKTETEIQTVVLRFALCAWPADKGTNMSVVINWTYTLFFCVIYRQHSSTVACAVDVIRPGELWSWFVHVQKSGSKMLSGVVGMETNRRRIGRTRPNSLPYSLIAFPRAVNLTWNLALRLNS